MSFLNAEWRKLLIANYKVDPNILKPYVPAHTELDLWNGQCYVSLVGFMFLNTRMLGIKFPFHVNFEEVNLRFYVKHFDGVNWKRGVVFIKEIVPKPALTFVANTVYKEHYQTMPMNHHWATLNDSRFVEYAWKHKEKWQKAKVVTDLMAKNIENGSETEFITEHYWGYSRLNEKVTYEYEVTHPKWQHYEVKDYEINVDFGLVYGKAFQHLSQQVPSSIMLAEGSEITVENKRRLG